MKQNKQNADLSFSDSWKKVISSFFVDSNEKKRPKCEYCIVQDACWENIVVKSYCCDECVPRGCSCRLYIPEKRRHFSVENYIYKTDSNGNDLPCEDWVNF